MNQASAQSGSQWATVVALYVVVFFAIGGTSVPATWALTAQTVLGSALLVGALWRLRSGFSTRLAAAGSALALATVCLPLVQLIPLPYSMWSHFAGRSSIVDLQALTAVPPSASPLSLSALTTRADALAILPAFAVFLAGLTFPPRHFLRICVGITAFGLVQVLLGLAQRFQGEQSSLYIFGGSANGLAVGTYANRNFFAAELATCLPFAAAMMAIMATDHGMRVSVAGLAAIVLSAVLLMGLGANESRAGIIMCIPAIIGAIILFSRAANKDAKPGHMLPMLLSGLAVMIVGQASVLGLLRLAQTDPASDYRSTFAKVTWQAVQQYWPDGSGLGTFVPVYQTLEVPETLLPQYVNHAHNDWLELLLEGGAPAAALLVLFLCWLLWALYAAWRGNSTGQTALMQRTASLVALLLLGHSLVDYPLRTPALMVLFALCCALMAAPPLTSSLREKRAKSKKVGQGDQPLPRRPFQRPAHGFGSREQQ
jgi:O-antigen ligase